MFLLYLENSPRPLTELGLPPNLSREGLTSTATRNVYLSIYCMNRMKTKILRQIIKPGEENVTISIGYIQCCESEHIFDRIWIVWYYQPK